MHIQSASYGHGLPDAGNVSELLPMLKGMPAEELASKQANVKKYASYFRYRQTAAEELDPSIRQPTATDAILEAVCEHAKHVGTRYKAPRASGSSMKLAIFSFFQVREAFFLLIGICIFAGWINRCIVVGDHNNVSCFSVTISRIVVSEEPAAVHATVIVKTELRGIEHQMMAHEL